MIEVIHIEGMPWYRSCNIMECLSSGSAIRRNALVGSYEFSAFEGASSCLFLNAVVIVNTIKTNRENIINQMNIE